MTSLTHNWVLHLTSGAERSTQQWKPQTGFTTNDLGSKEASVECVRMVTSAPTQLDISTLSAQLYGATHLRGSGPFYMYVDISSNFDPRVPAQR